MILIRCYYLVSLRIKKQSCSGIFQVYYSNVLRFKCCMQWSIDQCSTESFDNFDNINNFKNFNNLSSVDILLVHSLIQCSACIDPRRCLWDRGQSALVLGDSNCWRRSNKYLSQLTRSIYWTVLTTKTKQNSNLETGLNQFCYSLLMLLLLICQERLHAIATSREPYQNDMHIFWHKI